MSYTPKPSNITIITNSEVIGSVQKILIKYNRTGPFSQANKKTAKKYKNSIHIILARDKRNGAVGWESSQKRSRIKG